MTLRPMAIRLVSVPPQDVAGVASASGGVVSVRHAADLQVLAHALAQQRQHARDLDEREQIVVQLEGADLGQFIYPIVTFQYS